MELSRQWEKFLGGPARNQLNVYRVTINRKGLIYMNTPAYKLIGQPKAVTLYYNRDEDSIAVVGGMNSAENFAVNRKQNGWGITAASFCRHFRIQVPNTEQFVFPKRDEEGRLILNLRETFTVGGIARKRK